ncbi:MAG: hypothetical protein PHQ63_06340 [Smithellaceae bacterium]|jgi:hypothetical protein|nr:hypothetical protein [Smithellaceae bacterium]
MEKREEERTDVFVIPPNYKGNLQLSIFSARNLAEGIIVFVAMFWLISLIPITEMWLKVVLITVIAGGAGIVTLFGRNGYAYSQYLFIWVRFLIRRRKYSYRRIFRG